MSNKQEVGLNRNTIDKYYTSESVVKTCMGLIKKYITISPDDLVIEPSAGNGSFINHIKLIVRHYIFYDLEPDHSEIIKQDYLELNYDIDLEPLCQKDKQIHIIGNPPFGRQSSFAIKFIKKSCEFCDSLSFILPKSFKKDSMKKHFPLKYHLRYEYDLPDNSFIVDGKIHNVPCVFQIWEKQKITRTIPKKIIPNNYIFVKNTQNPDISFRRVGVNAGKIDRVSENKSVQSHYFIKFENILTDALYQQLSDTKYDCKNDTVGPRSISKPELIKEFNKVIK